MTTTITQVTTRPPNQTLVLRLRPFPTPETARLLDAVFALLQQHAADQQPLSIELTRWGIELLKHANQNNTEAVAERLHTLRHRILANRVDGSPLKEVITQGDEVGERWMWNQLVDLGLRSKETPLQTHTLGTALSQIEEEILHSDDPFCQELTKVVLAQENPEDWLDPAEMQTIEPSEARSFYVVQLFLRNMRDDAQDATARISSLTEKAKADLQASAERVNATTQAIISHIREGEERLEQDLTQLDQIQQQAVAHYRDELTYAHGQIQELTARTSAAEERVRELSEQVQTLRSRLSAAESQNAANANACRQKDKSCTIS